MIILEYIIKLKEMKKKDVAAIAEVYPQVLNDWLKQRRPIPKDKLIKLSDYFDIPMEYFEKESNAQNQIAVNSLLNKSEKVEKPSKYNDVIPLVLDDLEKLLRNDTQVESLLIDGYNVSDRVLEVLTDLALLLNIYAKEDVSKIFIIENFFTMLLMRDTSWEKNVEESNDELWKDLFIVLKKHKVI
ncbi:helix-turn-helix transcriptional regulator [Bacillus sp. S13(2024)]|uniref:helix-turn-helix domain-containing protein n=1 Tax=unclassified Bacillus (in: firmicutes) TaxID=185979 RepID=UPI003D223B57